MKREQRLRGSEVKEGKGTVSIKKKQSDRERSRTTTTPPQTTEVCMCERGREGGREGGRDVVLERVCES